MKCTLVLVLALFCAAPGAPLQAQPSTPCRDCPPPATCGSKDSLMKVTFRDRTVLDDCMSAMRTTMTVLERPEQAVKLSFMRGGACADTTVPTANIESFSIVGLGLSGQPCNVIVMPVREFVRNAMTVKQPHNFLEITGNIGYAGSDTSARKIGASTIYPGLELTLAPFGDLLGDKLALGLQAGMMLESGRMRFPLGAQLRLSIAGRSRVQTVSGYKPGPCSFSTGSIYTPSEIDFTEIPSVGQRDSSAYFFLDKQLVQPTWRPFVFAEGGTFLNGGFDGAGKTPSLNEDEYGQYYVAGGVGTPILSWLTASLEYRFMRLNVRTPCEYCPPPSTQEFFVTNTAKVHSIVLKFGVRWEW